MRRLAPVVSAAVQPPGRSFARGRKASGFFFSVGDELGATTAERARKAHSRVLQAMEDPGTARTVAQVLGVSESTVSRIKSEKLQAPEEYVSALHTMAKLQMQSAAPTLEWD